MGHSMKKRSTQNLKDLHDSTPNQPMGYAPSTPTRQIKTRNAADGNFRCGDSSNIIAKKQRNVKNFLRTFYGLCWLRRNGFHLHRLGRDTHGYGVGRNVPGGDAHGAEQAMFVYPDAAHHRCVIGNTRLGTDFGAGVGDDHAVIQVVLVGVDIGVVGYGAAGVHDDLSTVIQQYILVDHAVVFDRQVVAVGKLHAVEYLDVLAHMLEDVFREHGAEAESLPVVDPNRRAVIHHPEPDQGFALAILGCVHVAVVFGLESRVARIKIVDSNLLG